MSGADSDSIIGIDLGTTNSLAAWCDASGTPRVLLDADRGGGPAGEGLLPSVVRYAPGGRPEAVGSVARDHAAAHAGWTISSVKRLMGRSRADAADVLAALPYEVIEGSNATARVRLPDGTELSPPEVSAAVLRRLKDRASAALGREVNRAVVTVPAYFDDAQRQATRDAGRLAGLEVVRILNEPTAAALAYGMGLRRDREETIAVYDLGGGTFDVTILRVIPRSAAGGGQDAEPATDFFHVLATKGDTRLGGDDADRLLADHLLRQFDDADRAALMGDASSRQRLKDEAERVKIELTDRPHSTIRLTFPAGAPCTVEHAIARDEFEALVAPWIERSLELCRRALRDAGLTPRDIDRVVMVGGSTRIPAVRRAVGTLFGREPYTALNPDEVVALGAAVQASILSGAPAGMLLLDVIPLSLGIETAGGAFAKLIVRNTTIPARATEMFSTSANGQTSIKLNVLQGEREMAADCRSLGVFHLRGIPPMPAGLPQVEVEFLVDASGILSVSALEKRSGTRAALQIVPNHGLTENEIARMEAESLAHARDDMTRHRVVDLIANSKLDLGWIADRLAKAGDALPAETRADIESRAAELRAMVERAEADWRAVDANAFHSAKESLDRASVRLHEVSIARTLREQ